jgi:hypothetical protein
VAGRDRDHVTGDAVSLAYPCAGLVLLGLVAGALAASKWRAQGTWLLIAVALLLFAASDVVYLSVGGQSTEALNLASIGWPLAFLLLAAAAWLPGPAARAAPADGGRRRIAVPIGLAAAVVGLLALGSFVPIGAIAVGLGIACLVAVLFRLAMRLTGVTGFPPRIAPVMHQRLTPEGRLR